MRYSRRHGCNRIEVGQVGWEEEEIDACRSEQLAHAAVLVATEIVDDDDAAGFQFGDEELLDPGCKACPVDRPTELAKAFNSRHLQAFRLRT